MQKTRISLAVVDDKPTKNYFTFDEQQNLCRFDLGQPSMWASRDAGDADLADNIPTTPAAEHDALTLLLLRALRGLGT